MFRELISLLLLSALLAVTCSAQSGASSQTTYEYDTVGRLVQVRYADSSTITYTYDRMGNILSITAHETNRAPLSVQATISTDEDTPSTLVVPQVDDPNAGDTHTFAIITQPAHGTASLESNALRYTPFRDYHGDDSFAIRATDGGGLSVDGSAAVTVHSINDAPEPFYRLAPVDSTTMERTIIPLSWTTSGDVDNDIVEYTLRVQVAGIDTTFVGQDTVQGINFREFKIPDTKQSVLWAVTASDGELTATPVNGEGYFILEPVVGIDRADAAAPRVCWLDPAYPNPFAGETTIRYGTTIPAALTVRIYDVNGRAIETLVDRWHEPGQYIIRWRAEQWPTGVYLCRLSVSGEVRHHRILHMK